MPSVRVRVAYDSKPMPGPTPVGSVVRLVGPVTLEQPVALGTEEIVFRGVPPGAYGVEYGEVQPSGGLVVTLEDRVEVLPDTPPPPQSADVVLTLGPGLVPRITRRKGNTSKSIAITVNRDARVDVKGEGR